jgi:hypothetical protein
MPERTSPRPWWRPDGSAIIDGVIHHADAALASWFGELDEPVDVTFELSNVTPGDGGRSTTMSLLLAAVREQASKRNTESRDVRDDDGRVVARQPATRYFELDYVCSVTGPHPDAHRQLGRVLQLMVDHDVVPLEHLPPELADLDEPVEVAVVAPTASLGTTAASLTIRLVVPVRPTPEREISRPAIELHLDMAPAPGRTEAATSDTARDGPVEPVPERRWTTVRRRERITPGTSGDAGAT